MTFPLSTTIPTSNLNSPDSDPSLARVDLLQAVQLLNQIIASANGNNGVLVLNGLGKISAARLPGSLAVTGDISLQPSTGVININRVLRLQNTFTTDLGTAATGTTSPSAGDLVFLVDGDAGQPCIGCYDGSQWRVIRLMTQVGDVGAALSATATLTAEADA
jgi:hypothetical protein